MRVGTRQQRLLAVVLVHDSKAPTGIQTESTSRASTSPMHRDDYLQLHVSGDAGKASVLEVTLGGRFNTVGVLIL